MVQAVSSAEGYAGLILNGTEHIGTEHIGIDAKYAGAHWRSLGPFLVRDRKEVHAK